MVLAGFRSFHVLVTTCWSDGCAACRSDVEAYFGD